MWSTDQFAVGRAMVVLTLGMKFIREEVFVSPDTFTESTFAHFCKKLGKPFLPPGMKPEVGIAE